MTELDLQAQTLDERFLAELGGAVSEDKLREMLLERFEEGVDLAIGGGKVVSCMKVERDSLEGKLGIDYWLSNSNGLVPIAVVPTYRTVKNKRDFLERIATQNGLSFIPEVLVIRQKRGDKGLRVKESIRGSIVSKMEQFINSYGGDVWREISMLQQEG